MKSLALISALLFALTGFSMAATNNQGKPTNLKSQTPASHPLLNQINLRVRNQSKEIHGVVKSGKVTKEQAKSIRLNLVNIRKQELTFLKQTGNPDLTTDQFNQLNQTMDKNSSMLGESPSTAGSNTNR